MAVLAEESERSEEVHLGRRFVAEELGFEIVDNDCNVPLLSLLVHSLRQQKKSREIAVASSQI